jgi:hypothetical protein
MAPNVFASILAPWSSRCHRPREFSPTPTQGVRDPRSGESAHRCSWEGQGWQHCLCLVQHVVISSLPYRELGSSNTTVSLRQTFVTLEVRLISYWRLLILLLIGKV